MSADHILLTLRDYLELVTCPLKREICDEEALRKGKYPRLMDGEQCNDPNEAVHFPVHVLPPMGMLSCFGDPHSE